MDREGGEDMGYWYGPPRDAVGPWVVKTPTRVEFSGNYNECCVCFSFSAQYEKLHSQIYCELQCIL